MDVADNLHAVRQRELSRRRVSKILLAAGVGVATVPASPARAQGGPQGSYLTWGGFDIPEHFGPCERKNGALPDFAVFDGTEEALLKVRGGFVVDVAHPCNAGLLRWVAPRPLDRKLRGRAVARPPALSGRGHAWGAKLQIRTMLNAYFPELFPLGAAGAPPGAR